MKIVTSASQAAPLWPGNKKRLSHSFRPRGFSFARRGNMSVEKQEVNWEQRSGGAACFFVRSKGGKERNISRKEVKGKEAKGFSYDQLRCIHWALLPSHTSRSGTLFGKRRMPSLEWMAFFQKRGYLGLMRQPLFSPE
jgi:hypothetical protein